MLKLLFILPSVLLFAILPQEPSSSADKSPAAQPATVLVNPVKATSESQAHAKMVYEMDCAICHGVKGNGKGDLVADMQLKIKDFADPETLKAKSDGELFNVIKAGDDKVKMPAEGPRAKDEVLWNLVVYIRSFSNK